MHKYDLPKSWEDEVRGSGQGFAMEAEAKSQPVRQAAYRQLWLGIRSISPNA